MSLTLFLGSSYTYYFIPVMFSHCSVQYNKQGFPYLTVATIQLPSCTVTCMCGVVCVRVHMANCSHMCMHIYSARTNPSEYKQKV